MKILLYCLLLLGGVGQASFAPAPVLLARYPLKTNGTDALGKNSSLRLFGIDFDKIGANCQGAYDDFEAGKGVMILAPPIEGMNMQNFSVRVDFQVSKMELMPVFAIDRSCRHLMFYLTQSGKVALWAVNGDIKKESTLAYKTNTWHTATLVYANKTAILYLDKTEALRVPVTLSASCLRTQNANDISTTNFSNGGVFQGYWRDLRVYRGVWTPQTKEAPLPTGTGGGDKPKPDNPKPDNPKPDNPKPDNPKPENPKPDNPKPNNPTAWRSLDFPVVGKPSTGFENLRRQFYSFQNKAGNLEVAWQDQDNKKVYLSRFDANLQKPQQITLPTPPNTELLAVTNDNEDNYYYAVYKKKTTDAGNDILTMCKADKNGKQLAQQVQSSAQKDLDLWDIGSYAGVLAYSKGKVAMFMARRMNKSSDGLNHQGGIGALFDASNMQILRNYGQTSGHSFDNFLMVNKNGEFIGMDLGDNYPRGINMHKFDENSTYIQHKLVYTFKTYHGTTPKSPAGQAYPKYDEISTPQQVFYKWSNDNGTYTELGGIVEVNDGYLVIFAGEPDATGKSINNARATAYETIDARNLGFVKVRKDFENAQTLKEAILSKGASEVGGFYTFGGDWSKQANEGVVWLTKHKNPKTENVMHIKTIGLPNGNTLVLYATDKSGWGEAEAYQPYMMTLDANGKISSPATALDKKIAFNRRDEALLVGKRVVVVQGITEAGNALRLHILELK